MSALSLAALGVVYGDIGTSPLYAMRESLEGPGHVLDVSSANVLGVLSLTFWSLVIVISIKYLAFVMRADNDGEGGILALTALISPGGSTRGSRLVLITVGLFGTALLYGDGMITPAISVRSAVEGTAVATSSLEDWVIPISIVILIGLFAVQRNGTARIGRVFGPVMVLWFGTLGVLGAIHIVGEPSVLRAINPAYGVDFFADNGFKGFLALGSVFLVVTGGEALYADMGHFGKRPIQIGWFGLVLPGLLLNYFGQGALLLAEPDAIENPFYRLVPQSVVLPLVVLATVATVIASQALISGAFSLTMQAVQLGYAPRFRIIHTSPSAFGQIYIPAVNWILMVSCTGLVVGFRSSTSLAAAYGVAVTLTMIITTALFYVVLRGEHLQDPPRRVVPARDRWHRRDAAHDVADRPPDPRRPHPTSAAPPRSVPRRGAPRRRPGARCRDRGVHVLRHGHDTAGVDHQPSAQRGAARQGRRGLDRHGRRPRVAADRRASVTDHGHGVSSVELNYGFMEEPDVCTGLTEGDAAGLGVDPDTATFFLGAESLIVTDRPGMAQWREHLFALMSRNATSAANYFGLPPDRTTTIGMRVEL